MLCGHGMLVYVGYTLGLPVSPCSRDSALSARGGLDSAGHIRDGVSDRAVWPDGGCECTCTGTLLRCSVPTSFAPGALFLLECMETHPCVCEQRCLCRPAGVCTRIRVHIRLPVLVGEGCFLEVEDGRASLPLAGRDDGNRKSVRSGLLETQLCGEGGVL